MRGYVSQFFGSFFLSKNALMQRYFNTLFFIFVLITAGLSFMSPSMAETLDVELDQAKIIKIPDKTQTLIIGNPIIADVTMLKSNGIMVVTGKGYGQTNMIALDSAGTPVAETIIKVHNSRTALLVQRGLDRESFSCNPDCMPTPVLGDGKSFSDVVGQIQAHNNSAQSSNGVGR